ncbi:unnamed protein product, partial [Ectocarpus sp. 12 AP-2014]
VGGGGEFGSRTWSQQQQRGVSFGAAGGRDDFLVSRGRMNNSPPPKFPLNGSRAQIIAWQQRMMIHMDNKNLGYVFSADAQEIPVVNCDDRAVLARKYGDGPVSQHVRAFGILLEAVTNAPFVPRLRSCASVRDVWKLISHWVLPSSP